MTDLADIGLGVDTTEINSAKSALDGLENKWSSMVATLIREDKRLQQALKASAAIQSAALFKVTGAEAVRDLNTWGAAQRRRMSLMQESEKIAQRQAAAEAQVNEQLREQARLSQATINKNLGVTQPSAVSGGAGFGALEAEAERLALKYNNLYAASKLYENSLNELNRAHMLGAINTKQHEAAVESLAVEYQNFNSGTVTGMNRFQAAAQQTSNRTNQLGVVVQQTGYQVGDFLVQVQSGQNWMVAFGQQATQLVGVLPLMSAQFGMSTGALIAWSTGLGIAIPLITAIGAAWMRSREASEEEGSKMEEVLRRLGSEADSLSAKLSNLKFGSDDGQRMFDLSLQVASLNEELKSLENQLANTGGRQIGIINNKIAATKEMLQLAIQELALTSDATNKKRELQSAVDAIKRSQDQLAAAEAAQNATNIFQLNQRIAKMIELRTQAALAAEGAERMADAINGIRDAAVTISVNFKASYSGFAAGFMNLAKGALGNAMDLAQNPDGVMFSSPRPEAAPTDIDFGVGGGSGGGGGGGGSSLADKLKEELKTLQQHYGNKAELEIEEYEKSRETLKSALDAKLLTIQEYNALELALSKDHAEALAQIDVYRYGSAIDKAGKWFGDMAAATQGGGEKLLRISKVFGAAEALVNSYKAYTDVIADKTLPWYAKIPAAVSVLSAGLGMVSAIKGVSAGGGSGGGGGGRGSASVSANSAPAAPQRVLVQGINPDDIFTGQWLSNFFDNFYKENNDRGAVFMVNR